MPVTVHRLTQRRLDAQAALGHALHDFEKALELQVRGSVPPSSVEKARIRYKTRVHELVQAAQEEGAEANADDWDVVEGEIP